MSRRRRTDDATVCVCCASLVGAALLTLALPIVWRPMSAGAWLLFVARGPSVNGSPVVAVSG